MNDRQIGGILAVFTVGAIFAIYAFQQAGGTERARLRLEQAAIAEKQKAEEALRKLCRRVTGECQATAKIKAANCNVAQAKAELERLLGAPIKQPGCEQLESSMATGCAGPCVYDSASLLLFAGKISFDPPGPKQADGSCEIVAHKPVTASAHCVPKASQPAATN